MNKFQRSWHLLKSSIEVMRRDKQLLLFPIITTICTCVVAVLFMMPVAFRPTGHSYASAEHWKAVGNSIYSVNTSDSGSQAAFSSHSYRNNRYEAVQRVRPLAVAYFAVVYFVSMFIATFFNVAFYHEIMNALNGQPVSIGGGLSFAATKWQSILMWTIFAGAVGYTIKALEERFGLIGRLVMRLVGTAWSIACVFVIPVLITSERSKNPLSVLKESALTLKNTWGESLIGYAGVSFGSAIIVLLSVLWLAGGIFIAASLQLYWLIALIVAMWFIAMVLWAYVLSVASQIFRCALFLYASHGTLPAPYTDEMVALAWRVKKS
jgi:hypothetical protein